MFRTTRLDEWVPLIKGEFLEMPSLTLTAAQAARRWDLSATDMEFVLESFVDGGFLTRSWDGVYGRPRPHDERGRSRPSASAKPLRVPSH